MEKWICNPLDLEYRYQYRTSLMGGYSLAREAADPTLLLFRDTYYLFASMSGGFWYSDDLADWKFKETPELPIYDYAPDVRSIGGRVVFSASRRGEPCTFYASTNPLTEPFQPLTTPFDFWDPDMFEDDDGRVYFYWGCTNKEPIWGIEIDPKTMLPIGERQAMFGEDEAHHGWERKGENNNLSEPVTEMERLIRQYVGTKPFIEGAFMTKYRGKYYLQYAAPGTECNVYADGVYVSGKPLGPFTYQIHNPFSSKPGGFITSAGHGSTIQDKYGNWWHASTMRVSVNESFERRIGLFPCDFDEDGMLHCNQHFADYPFILPEGVRTLPLPGCTCCPAGARRKRPALRRALAPSWGRMRISVPGGRRRRRMPHLGIRWIWARCGKSRRFRSIWQITKCLLRMSRRSRWSPTRPVRAIFLCRHRKQDICWRVRWTVRNGSHCWTPEMRAATGLTVSGCRRRRWRCAICGCEILRSPLKAYRRSADCGPLAPPRGMRRGRRTA